MASKSGAIRIEFFGHDRTLGRSFDKAWRKADTFSKKLALVSGRMTDIGSKLTRSVTLPLVALGTIGVRESIKFESAFAGVRKTVDATEAEFGQLRQGIRDMAKELPSSREEIAGVAESAGQLGIKTKNILGFTRTMIDLGESTNLAADQAATSFARFANITKMPQKNFERLGSSVVALGNNMATTEAEIVEMGMRIAGAGEQVGMSEPQVMALAAALSSVGIEAEAGGTAVSKTMIGIESAVQKGGKQLQLWAETAGMGAKEFTAAWEKDPAAALNSVVTGLGDMEKQGGSTLKQLEKLGITEVRQRDALLRAAGAGDLLTQALDISGQAWQDNTALSKEAAQRYKTTASQLSILKNKASDAAMSFGEALAPSLSKAVDWAGRLTSTFDDLSAGQKNYIVQAGMVAAAAGPVFWTFGKLGSGAAVAVAGVSHLTRSLGAMNAAFRVGGIAAWGTTLAGTLGPVGLVTAGIVAAGGLIYGLYKLDQAMQKNIASTEDFKRVTEALGSEGAEDLQRWMDKKLGGHYVVKDGELVWEPKTTVDDGGLKEAVVKGVKAAGVAERRAMQEEALLTQIAATKIAADKARAVMDAEAPRKGKGGGQAASPEFLAAQEDLTAPWGCSTSSARSATNCRPASSPSRCRPRSPTCGAASASQRPSSLASPTCRPSSAPPRCCSERRNSAPASTARASPSAASPPRTGRS
jgi:TP901 family phage tail tape measure protein